MTHNGPDPGRVPDTCRYCGTTGITNLPEDPAPGVCPTCLALRLDTAVLGARMQLRAGVDGVTASMWLYRELRAIGLRERVARGVLAGARTEIRG